MTRLVLAFMLVALAGTAGAQVVVQGRVVTIDSVGIAGARVEVRDSIDRTEYSATTDSTGSFRIRLAQPVQAGLFFVRVEMLGYRTLDAVPLRLGEREELTVLLRMDVAAIPIEPLKVSARGRYIRGPLDDYFDRAASVKRYGGGTIIGYDELQRRPFMNVSMLMSERLPSLRNCPPIFFLDGMRIPLDELRTIQLNLLEGIEIYRSGAQVPVQYQNRATCGAVLIWTQLGDKGEGKPLSWRRVFMTVGFLALGVLLLR